MQSIAPSIRSSIAGSFSGALRPPSLGLYFYRNAYSMGAIGSLPSDRTFSDLITFTRASSGSRFNSAVLFEMVGTDVPRFDYDPVTSQSRGLLSEDVRTNSLLRSSEFDNAYWTKTRLTVSPDAITASFGELVDQLVEDASASTTHLITRSVTYTSGVAYTRSVVVKDNGRDIRLNFPSAAFGSLIGSNFNLATGGTGNVSAGVIARVEIWGGGWYRCSITATATATAAGNDECRLADRSTGGTIYNGNGVSGVYIWGADLQAGALPTSHIPTAASTVTRAADSTVINTLSPWYNAAEGFWRVTAEGIVGQPLLTAGSLQIVADSASLKTYDLAYSSDPLASNVVLGRGHIHSVQYWPRADV